MSNMLRRSSRKRKVPSHIHQDRVISASRGQPAVTIASRMLIPPAAAPVTSRMMVTATTPASCSLSTVGGVVNSHSNTAPSYVGQDQVISVPLRQPAVTLASRMVITPVVPPVTSRLVVTATTPALCSLSTDGDVTHDNNTGIISYPVGINKASDDLAKNVSQN